MEDRWRKKVGVMEIRIYESGGSEWNESSFQEDPSVSGSKIEVGPFSK